MPQVPTLTPFSSKQAPSTNSSSDQFRNDMQAAWDEYRETGLHVSGKEVFAWMDTWFSDNESPAPNPHAEQI